VRAEGRLSAAGEPVYGGRCREAGLPLEGNAVRLRVPRGAVVRWRDERCGGFSERVDEQCGDFVLRDRLGQWSYQLAATVDDMAQGIDLIVRGEDLLASTARQLWLAQQLGRGAPPLFLHHALMCDAEGSKLSKRLQSASIRAERLAGVPPERLLAEVRAAMGG
jgi:glutamyl-tRNA synthetase/glutamyl-Q tRNA(Asp) synthetase